MKIKTNLIFYFIPFRVAKAQAITDAGKDVEKE